MIQIRKSFPTDAYALINIQDIVWRDEYYDVLPNGILHDRLRDVNSRVEHLRNQIEENNRIIVALDDDRIVGYIFYAKAQSVVYASAAEIRSIYVLADYQGQGIGRMLFEGAKEELIKLGFNSVIINCPSESRCIDFFLKLGAERRENVVSKILDYAVNMTILYLDLYLRSNSNLQSNDWNLLYERAQDKLILLNDVNREVAVIMTDKGNFYFGLGIKNNVCPIEVAMANMYLGEEKKVLKILILDRNSKPVLPCGKCRDLLVSLGQEEAEILFDLGSLKTMSFQELNPYYKDEEKV